MQQRVWTAAIQRRLDENIQDTFDLNRAPA